jgi:hypothetical protein
VTFVPYCAWAGAEIAVAIVCLSLPTLRPLYLRKCGVSIGRWNEVQSYASELPQFTMVEHKSEGAISRINSTKSLLKVEPDLKRPPSAHVRRRSSLDEIYGLYCNNPGVIMVKKEIKVYIDDANWPLKS